MNTPMDDRHPKRDRPDRSSGAASRESPAEPTLDRQIADHIMQDIIDWRLEPGHWIREREVAERFGVSHGPVREAFRHLSREGFVEIVPWRDAAASRLEIIDNCYQ